MIHDFVQEHKRGSIGRSKIKSACWIAFNEGYHQNYTGESYRYIKDRFEDWFSQFEPDKKR